MDSRFVSVLFLFALALPFAACKVSPPRKEVLDPWIFEQRLDLFQRLLNASRYPPFFGDANMGNIVWGLPLQFEWQMSSGRLMNNGSRIAGFSWWACMNYYLSVIPYLGAVRAGFAPPIEFAPPRDNDAKKFCLNLESCNNSAVEKWSVYWGAVASLQNAGGKAEKPEKPEKPENPQKTKTAAFLLDDLIELLWDAHTTSLGVALPIFTAELEMLPSVKESDFGIGWGRFVHIIADTRFVSNHTQVSAMQADLPFRMLKNTDVPGKITDMPKRENEVADSMLQIKNMGEIEWTLFIDEWGKAMRHPECRQDGRKLIDDFVAAPAASFFLMLWELIHKCKPSM